MGQGNKFGLKGLLQREYVRNEASREWAKRGSTLARWPGGSGHLGKGRSGGQRMGDASRDPRSEGHNEKVIRQPGVNSAKHGAPGRAAGDRELGRGPGVGSPQEW